MLTYGYGNIIVSIRQIAASTPNDLLYGTLYVPILFNLHATGTKEGNTLVNNTQNKQYYITLSTYYKYCSHGHCNCIFLHASSFSSLCKLLLELTTMQNIVNKRNTYQSNHHQSLEQVSINKYKYINTRCV